MIEITGKVDFPRFEFINRGRDQAEVQFGNASDTPVKTRTKTRYNRLI